MTSVELMAKLMNDEDYLRRKKTREAELALRAAERGRNRQPVHDALAEVGIVETYDRATGKSIGDPKLFEVAISQLKSGAHDDDTRGWIARLCATREAAPYWDELEELFRAAPRGSRESDGLAAALSRCACSVHVDQMMNIVKNPEFGTNRIYFLRPINRLGRARGKEFVSGYVDDPELGREASAIMRGWSANQG
ncbi:hypothetical protein [Arthrobacter sp. RCC_34]|uniref:hypothetical protein n=1 Tax=Arthrobacter sp. RCC_34 TaxID=3239230 RepID=UPI0035261D10